MMLFDMIKAPNPRRVRMFLAEKSMSIFDSVPRTEIDIPGGANLAADYLAINPRGIVPTLLLDDGTVLDESIAICRYFEALHPEPNLMGTGALETAQIESAQRRMEFDGLFSIAAVFRNTAPAFAGRGMPGTGPALDQSADLVARGTMQTAHFFTELNARLGASTFIAGARFTIADITAFIAVEFARWVKLGPAEHHVHTHAWYQAMRLRPSARV